MYEKTNIPLTELKGIGPKKAELFAKLGINTVEDALYSFPREYEDRRNIKTIDSIMNEEVCMVKAQIISISKGRYVRGRKQTLRLQVSDGTAPMEVIFFNMAYMARSLKKDRIYWFFGKAQNEMGRVTMIHPQMGVEEDVDDDKMILPVYPLTAGMTQRERRRIADLSLDYLEDDMECLPEDTRLRHGLCGIEYALSNIHFPEDGHKMRAAKYRLIFEELLTFSMGLQLMKNRFEADSTFYQMNGIRYDKEFCDSLPFEMTSGQKKAVEDICNDMSSGKRMNRLIQGDVGSGKTAVGAAAVYTVIKNGYQAAFMAPTEILARQHFESFREMFAEFGINVEILISGLPAAQRRQALDRIENGEADLIVGTHAVFSKGVSFKNLALAVTDEQHRFGVMQREALNQKGVNPHILVMTATPIPRTLALVLYGDMDVSVIKDKPVGRKEIITKAWKADDRMNVYRFVYKELKKGRQAYIVSPLIEASENMNVRSSEEIYAEVEKLFRPYKTELLHGKMKTDEKDDIMNRFKDGEIQVLVSTVIIEVGINVPNASVMVIENSERFGLAQMHQLRGRVGRGENQSYCMLITDNESEVAIKRAEVMEQTADGMIIAEKDLELRGTGEFFGVRQHGVPDMRIADIIKHSKILREAMVEANLIMNEDPLLEMPKNRMMSDRIADLYGELNPSI